MHRRGYNATGVADIVEAAGVPKGTFYAQFESKQAFTCEVVEAWSRNEIETADAHLAIAAGKRSSTALGRRARVDADRAEHVTRRRVHRHSAR
jgi:AcrR family transcriptional regulator